MNEFWNDKRSQITRAIKEQNYRELKRINKLWNRPTEIWQKSMIASWQREKRFWDLD